MYLNWLNLYVLYSSSKLHCVEVVSVSVHFSHASVSLIADLLSAERLRTGGDGDRSRDGIQTERKRTPSEAHC